MQRSPGYGDGARVCWSKITTSSSTYRALNSCNSSRWSCSYIPQWRRGHRTSTPGRSRTASSTTPRRGPRSWRSPHQRRRNNSRCHPPRRRRRPRRRCCSTPRRSVVLIFITSSWCCQKSRHLSEKGRTKKEKSARWTSCWDTQVCISFP